MQFAMHACHEKIRADAAYQGRVVILVLGILPRMAILVLVLGALILGHF